MTRVQHKDISQMDTAILKAKNIKEYYFDERCYITEISNSSNDSNVSIAKARVTPGTTTVWHKLTGITERYLIISGTGSVEVGENKPEQVGEGDVVIIPADTRQRITNTDKTDLIFYAICSPRFRPNCYISLEEEYSITMTQL